MSHLFTPLTLRELTLRNRIFVSPMCQYSGSDGLPNDWHLVHLGSRAVGGAALVLAEATAVSAEGRITPHDTGIWNDQQAQAWKRIAAFIKQQGSVPGLQLAHAGRKASTDAPWSGGKPLTKEQGGWETLGPSPVAFDSGHPVPKEMSLIQIEELLLQFKNAARRALDAGFEIVEIHAAHGYLLHQFLSPLSNWRTDDFGGSLENRMRLVLEVTRVVRDVWPAKYPLFVRISATDWAAGGWDLESSVELCKRLKKAGADLIDCSSGGLVPKVHIPTSAGYQVPFAETIKREAGIATGAVGLVTSPAQAEEIVSLGRADAVLLARELLRNPYWPLMAAKALSADVPWPKQYDRAKPH